MTDETAFPHAGFQRWLEHAGVPVPEMSPSIAAIVFSSDGTVRTPATHSLLRLLTALLAQQRAASTVERVADALRRYQKFTRAGQPSSHIVQLRQQQGAARQAASVAKQHFIEAAAIFAGEAGMEVPARMALEPFITRWIAANVPVGQMLTSRDGSSPTRA